MIIKVSPYFKKRLKKRLIKTPALKKKIAKQLEILQKDIRHPSLKVHKLKGRQSDRYAVWIEGNLRITFALLDESIYLADIITHDEY